MNHSAAAFKCVLSYKLHLSSEQMKRSMLIAYFGRACFSASHNCLAKQLSFFVIK